MAGPYILTYYDAYSHLQDFVGKDGTAPTQRDIIRAIQNAQTELSNAHEWDYLLKEGRIRLSAPYTTGTITYDHTGGTNEREITLSGGTWPDWADNGKIRIGVVNHNIATRESDTVLTLDPVMNPGSDVAAGTSYTLFRSDYPLPQDMVSMGQPLNDDNWWFNNYVTPDELQRLEKHGYTTGSVYAYTIKGSENYLSQLMLSIYPAADAADSMDFMYHRRQRQLRITGNETTHKQGTITVSSGSATVTGSGTNFTSDMVGSVIRLGDTSNTPTGLDGRYPYADERSIVAVASTTSITLDAAVTQAFSGVKYLVTDPVDIDRAMVNVFLRCCEKHMAKNRRMDDKNSIEGDYVRALREAKASTRRVRQERFCGDARPSRFRRLAHFPLGDDIT